MKTLVKPTKPFMLMLEGGNMEPLRPSLVVQSAFMQSKIAAGEVEVLMSEVPDEVTDADFLKTYKETVKKDKNGKPVEGATPDEDLAVSSFKSEIPGLVKKAKGEERAEEKAAAEAEEAEEAARAAAEAQATADAAAVSAKAAGASATKSSDAAATATSKGK